MSRKSSDCDLSAEEAMNYTEPREEDASTQRPSLMRTTRQCGTQKEPHSHLRDTTEASCQPEEAKRAGGGGSTARWNSESWSI